MTPALPANPRLDALQPYPFERLRALLGQPWTGTVQTGADGSPLPFVDLSIGEPRHPTPAVVLDALASATAGLASYPATAGTPALREAIAGWIGRRYGAPVDPATQVLPVNGSREALFAFAQAMLDPAPGWHTQDAASQGNTTSHGTPVTRNGTQPAAVQTGAEQVVIAPNPFYQIYEGAALLAGARLHLVDQRPENGFAPDWQAVPEAIWQKTKLVYVCSPGNPTGHVLTLDDWKTLLALADRYGFIIASDECYSEIYRDENAPPLGALAVCQQLGRPDYRQVVVFSSLSKRSNVPGMRSGFVAGDAALLARFLRYRTYHGCAMSPMFQQASMAAWNDEAHVADNRRLYRQKFDEVLPILQPVVPALQAPSASFYLWLPVPGGDDERFAARLFHEWRVKVLPGSYLARPTSATSGRGQAGSAAPGQGLAGRVTPEELASNPGRGFVRIALVAPPADCVEGTRRIAALLRQ